MNGLVVVLQWALLVGCLPLLVTSMLTSRAHRRRHAGYQTAALLGVAVAVVLFLLSLALWLSGEEDIDEGMSFGPPLMTVVACAIVILRARQSVVLNRRR